MGEHGRDLVTAYWHLHQLSHGSRADRMAAEDLLWASLEVADSVRTAPLPQVLDLLEDLLTAPSADAAYVGAGPLETLLNQRPEADHLVADRCRHSPAAGAW